MPNGLGEPPAIDVNDSYKMTMFHEYVALSLKYLVNSQHTVVEKVDDLVRWRTRTEDKQALVAENNHTWAQRRAQVLDYGLRCSGLLVTIIGAQKIGHLIGL